MEEDKKRKLEEINRDMAIGVFDAEVEERVSVMRIELDSLCESMKNTIALELERVRFQFSPSLRPLVLPPHTSHFTHVNSFHRKFER